MVENIDQVIMRGEKIDLLVDKSEDLEAHSIKFNRQSRGLRRYMVCKNVKWTMLAVLLIGLIIFFIIMAFCGPSFKHCSA